MLLAETLEPDVSQIAVKRQSLCYRVLHFAARLDTPAYILTVNNPVEVGEGTREQCPPVLVLLKYKSKILFHNK